MSEYVGFLKASLKQGKVRSFEEMARKAQLCICDEANNAECDPNCSVC